MFVNLGEFFVVIEVIGGIIWKVRVCNFNVNIKIGCENYFNFKF